MADVAPMADEYRQLSGKSTTPLVHDIVCVHTMVGTLEGSISWSSRDGGSYWHFGLGGKGKLVQCQDLRYRAAANLQGNWHVIPIETADIKEGVFPDTWQNPPWTDAQIDKLVDLISWLCVRYNIPPVLIPDTKPGRRGLAYHRQGINPWRVDGGELWSNANGKTCPANRAAQFTNIVIPRVQAAVKGTPEPAPEEDEDVIIHFYCDGRPARVVVDGVVTGWRSNAARQAFVNGVKDTRQDLVKFPTEGDYEAFSASFVQGQDFDHLNEALDAAIEQWSPLFAAAAMRLQALLEVEAREEQRDTAPPS